MPEIRRSQLPQRLLVHLLTRMRERSLSHDQIVLLARWLDVAPTVPQGKWFKRFADFTVCDEGGLIKTFLLPGQAAEGRDLDSPSP